MARLISCRVTCGAGTLWSLFSTGAKPRRRREVIGTHRMGERRAN